MSDTSFSSKRPGLLFPTRWHRSSWVVVALVSALLLLANIPGQVVHYPRIELPNSLQSAFPIDWRFEHGWPWTYLVRAEFDHTAKIHMPNLWDDPSAASCWKLASDLPRLHYGAMFANSCFFMVLAYGSGLSFEWWRRKRHRLWQWHLIDLFAALTLLASILGVWMISRNRFQQEQRVLALPYAVEDQVADELRLEVIQGHSVQPGGPSWLRLLADESPLKPLDRVVSVYIPARELPTAAPFGNLCSVEAFHDASASELSTLSRFPHLEALKLFAVTVTDGDTDDRATPTQTIELPAMLRLRGLSLSLIHQPITGISKLKTLEVLEIDDCEFDDAGLRDLRTLMHLRALSLSGTKITGGGLVHLAGLTRMEKLVLDKTAIDNDGLRHLLGLHRLEELSLEETSISSAGLKQLVGLQNLHTLSLIEAHVSETDIALLKELDGLELLWVDTTHFSDKGIEELRRQLPNCEINVLNTRWRKTDDPSLEKAPFDNELR